MRINSSRKLNLEDFDAKDRALVLKLAGVLNPFLDQVTQVLAGNITPGDNIKSKSWSVDLPAGTTTKALSWDVNERPKNVQLAQLLKKNGDAPTAVFGMAWAYGNGTVTATFLGLDGATDYKATLIGFV